MSVRKTWKHFKHQRSHPKTCCLRISKKKLSKRNVLFHDVSLRFVDNSSSECLQNVAQFFHHRETRHTKLPQVQTEFSVAKTKGKGNLKKNDFPFHSTHSKLYRILHATKVDVKSLVVHFTIQSINYTFRCKNDKEMKNIWFTGFVISSESCIR